MPDPADPLLEIRDLHVSFFTDAGEVRAVRGVDLTLRRSETLAVVGESGCGKSVTALALLRLIEAPGRIVRGTIRFDGRDLRQLSEAELRDVRGARIGMVFQEPMTSLNPVFTAGDQIAEVLERHRGLSRAASRREAVRLLDTVGIPAPARRARQFPHELSGGMKQRVMIAMAIACRPDLLIADEPTTALDVTIQAQILELLRELQRELGMAILLITHNLGVVAHFAGEVAVMYAGRDVETAPVRALFAAPRHPYTQALLAALPRRGRHGRLRSIEGTVPSPVAYPPGCAFAPRCPSALERCASDDPKSVSVTPGHRVACWLCEGPAA